MLAKSDNGNQGPLDAGPPAASNAAPATFMAERGSGSPPVPSSNVRTPQRQPQGSSLSITPNYPKNAATSNAGPSASHGTTGAQKAPGTAARQTPTTTPGDGKQSAAANPSKRPLSTPDARDQRAVKRTRRGRVPSEIIVLDSDDDERPAPVPKNLQLARPGSRSEPHDIVQLPATPATAQDPPLGLHRATPVPNPSTSTAGRLVHNAPMTPASSRSDVVTGSTALSKPKQETSEVSSGRKELDTSRRLSQPLATSISSQAPPSGKIPEIPATSQTPRRSPLPASPTLNTDRITARMTKILKDYVEGKPLDAKSLEIARTVIQVDLSRIPRSASPSGSALAPRSGSSTTINNSPANGPVVPAMSSSAHAGPSNPRTQKQTPNSNSAPETSNSTTDADRFRAKHPDLGKSAKRIGAGQAGKSPVGPALPAKDTTLTRPNTTLPSLNGTSSGNPRRNLGAPAVPSLPSPAASVPVNNITPMKKTTTLAEIRPPTSPGAGFGGYANKDKSTTLLPAPFPSPTPVTSVTVANGPARSSKMAVAPQKPTAAHSPLSRSSVPSTSRETNLTHSGNPTSRQSSSTVKSEPRMPAGAGGRSTITDRVMSSAPQIVQSGGVAAAAGSVSSGPVPSLTQAPGGAPPVGQSINRGPRASLLQPSNTPPSAATTAGANARHVLPAENPGPGQGRSPASNDKQRAISSRPGPADHEPTGASPTALKPLPTSALGSRVSSSGSSASHVIPSGTTESRPRSNGLLPKTRAAPGATGTPTTVNAESKTPTRAATTVPVVSSGVAGQSPATPSHTSPAASQLPADRSLGLPARPEASTPTPLSAPKTSNTSITAKVIVSKLAIGSSSSQAILAKERQNRSLAVSRPVVSSPLSASMPITRPSEGSQPHLSTPSAHKAKSQVTGPSDTPGEGSKSSKSHGVRFADSTEGPAEATAATKAKLTTPAAPDMAVPAQNIWASKFFLDSLSSLQSIHDASTQTEIKVSGRRREHPAIAFEAFLNSRKDIAGPRPPLWQTTFNPEYALYLLELGSYDPRKLKPLSMPKLPFLKRNVRAGLKGRAAERFPQDPRLAQAAEKTTRYLHKEREAAEKTAFDADAWTSKRYVEEQVARTSRCHRLVHLSIVEFTLARSDTNARLDCADLPDPRAPRSGIVTIGRHVSTVLPFKLLHQQRHDEETGELLNLIVPSRPIDAIVPLDFRNDGAIYVQVRDLRDSGRSTWPDAQNSVAWQGAIDAWRRLTGQVTDFEIPLRAKGGISGVTDTMTLWLKGFCHFEFDYSEPMAPLAARIKPAKPVPNVWIWHSTVATHEEMEKIGDATIGDDPPVAPGYISQGYGCAFCSLGQLGGEEELYAHYAVFHAGECVVDRLSREEISDTLCIELRIRHGEAMKPLPAPPPNEPLDMAMDLDVELGGSPPASSASPRRELNGTNELDDLVDEGVYPDDPVMLANPFGLMQPQLVNRKNKYTNWSSRVVPGTVLDLLPELDKLYDGGRFNFYIRMVEESNVLSRYHLTEKRRFLMCAWNRWRLEQGPLSLYSDTHIAYLNGWLDKYGSVMRRADLEAEIKEHLLTLRTVNLITARELLAVCKHWDVLAKAERYERGEMNEDDEWEEKQRVLNAAEVGQTLINRDAAGRADVQRTVGQVVVTG